jgi:hypothetical protein
MTEQEKKTGMDLLREVHETIATFDRRLQNVEHLLKETLDAMNRQPAPAKEGLPPGLKLNDKPVMTSGGAPAPESKKGPSIEGTTAAPMIQLPSNTRVIGRIRGDDGRGLPGVNVTIYDAKNHTVKQTRTNRAGDWMASLPPGKYAAECVLEGKVNGNVVFNVKPGDRTMNVGQPQ